MSKRELPGMRWRVLAHKRQGRGYSGESWDHRFVPSDKVEFDELVVGGWFHMEQMSDREWWMRIGDYNLWVSVKPDGTVKVTAERTIPTI